MTSKDSSPFDIAIIGLACRFPGAENPEEFWDLLKNGGDAITEIPADRFNVDDFYDPDPDKPGTMYTRNGGFLKQVDGFDPTFFGIPPRTANAIDPQQRLALEVSWEALENSAIVPSTLRERDLGVFVGVSENDYARIAFQDPKQIDLHSGTGNLQAFVAGRIAYVLGVQGQALSINTACSSSLVAVHSACQALRLEECDLALAGGVQVILGPHNYIFLSQAKALSPDGHTKAFDASADGFARGEGCGMVVLKRLVDAQGDNDKILGVIRSSVVNNDGPSGGLVVPNVAAQERLLRSALQRACLRADQVSYLEAHGTGTIIGDPLELQAAGKVYGPERDPAHPLYIGSVKGNIGHSEAAAGIAGLIKVLLAMKHERIPKQINFNTPNPRIPWHNLPFKVATTAIDWPEGSKIAGVSSFGMSGTNAHVLVESFRDETVRIQDTPEQQPLILAFSAKNESALTSLASRYNQWLTHNVDTPLADICFSAATGREHFPYRAAILAESREQVVENLALLVEPQPQLTVGKSSFSGQIQKGPTLVMLFTGQGSQYSGMGLELYDSQPVFRKVLDYCGAILEPFLGLPLHSLLFDSAHEEKLNQTRYTQPALFSLEVALYELWCSVGIKPDVVMGHSLGEYAAAYAAGVFSLEDALELVNHRARLMGGLSSDGAMIAVFADLDQVSSIIAGSRVTIAAYNGTHLVVSGSETEVQKITDKFKKMGVRLQRLQTSHAFHSAQLDPILDDFANFATTINYRSPKRTLVSNLTGKVFASGETPDSSYWRRHSREPVQFSKSCTTVAELGGNILLEIGPQPKLTTMVLHDWPDKQSPTLINSLRKKGADNYQLTEALAQLYVAGISPDWNNWYDTDETLHKVDLPTYPFQRRRYWVERHESDFTLSSTIREKEENAFQKAGVIPPTKMPMASKDDAPATTFFENKDTMIQHLQYILQSIMGLDDLPDPGINFFDLGLDSLLALKLRGQIQNLINGEKELSIGLVLEHPTLATLADHLLIEFGPKCSTEQKEKTHLSIGQQALWFIYREAPKSAAYNAGLLLRFDTSLEIEALKRALRRLTLRHSILHSYLDEVDGVPCQWFDPDLEPDFRQWNAVEWEKESLIQKVQELSQQPFVLEKGVFRVDGFLDAEMGAWLLLGLHHIAGDARSMAILGQELLELYSAEVQGKKANLRSLPTSYADFVIWEETLLNSVAKATMDTYWQKQLADGISILQLPTDLPRPSVQTFNGASFRFSLSKNLSNQLRVLARREQCTLFSVLFTAFQVLLHRYTGQEDILIGVPTSTVRSNKSFNDMVGYLVNPMAVHGKFSAGEQISFFEQAARNQSTILTGLDHQPYPFPLLMEQLQPVTDPSYPPLVQALFAYETEALIPKKFSADGVVAENIPLAQMEGQFDVAMTFDDDEHTLSGTLNYNSDIFLPETAQRMSEHLQVLLEGIVNNPNRDVHVLPMLTKAESKHLIDWNRTDKVYSAEGTIVDLFEEQVEKTPSAIALVSEDEQLTYRQLNERANQLAHYLAKVINKTQPSVHNPLIAIAVERSVDMVVGLLGIIKAGAAYVPIDPNYPTKRIQYILDDSEASLLLTQSWLKAGITIDISAHTLVCIDEAGVQSQSVINPVINRNITDLVYVIYTSGSTGKPKGVMIEHKGLVNLALSQIDTFKLLPESNLLQFASFSFDASVSEIATTLLCGATLYIPSKYTLLDPTDFIDMMARERISHVTFPPSFLSNLSPGALPDLKTLVVAGETCPAELIEQWIDKVHFVNAYGPTENTVCASMAVYSQPSEISVHIGQPLLNTRIYILDSQNNLLPPGIPGEMCLAGVGLARGYLHRPELTAQKFVEIELLDKKERIYKTGDLARLLSDGNLEYMGRLDHQVKVRGFRIELGEIEAVLEQQTFIKEAVVTLHKTYDDKRLVAYLTSLLEGGASHAKLSPTNLRELLKEQLPHFMIPNNFIVLDKLPLTPNGKIDREVLTTPETTPLSQDKLPTSTENKLAGLWSTLFKVETINSHDNFFDLGGHSLIATLLTAKIRDSFKIELSVRAIFEHPQLTDLATAIDSAVGSASLPSIHKQPDDDLKVVSFAQQRLWFLDRLEEGESAVYNMPTALQLSGHLKIDAFKLALQWLMDRHDTLKSSYPDQAGEASVQIQSISTLEILAVHDLTHLVSVEQDEEVLGLTKLHTIAPFDLSRGPLFRVDLLLLSKEKSVLLLNMHHIIGDAWSMGLLIRDLEHAYTAFAQSRKPTLSPLKVQYSDYAVWQRDWLQGEVLRQQEEYWYQQLADAPQFLELPIDKPRPARQSYRGARYYQRLSPAVTQDLNDLSSSLKLSLFMTLLSVFNILLSRYCRVDDLCVGSPIANRSHSDTHDTVGFFVNTLVLRGQIKAEQTVTDLLLETRKTCLAAYAHQEIPFEMLVERLQPDRSLSHSPLFQVMFGFQNNDSVSLSLPEIKASTLPLDFPISKFDLSLEVEEREGELYCCWEYATDLFHESTIQRMADHFEVLLKGVIADPTQPIGQLPMLTSGETEAWLAWNNTVVDFPKEQTIVTLFEEQVANNPDQIAVVFEENQLTYKQLNTMANQLAHYLSIFKRDAHIPDNPLIAIVVDNSLETIVGLLAILKVGGAYVPIDPDYPEKRIHYILKDCAAPLLLTQSHMKDKSWFSLEGLETECLRVNVDEIDFANLPSKNIVHKSQATDLAYINYTSGSTGQPKGVKIPHQAVARLVKNTTYAQLDSKQTFLQYSSISFDAATFEIWGALLNSAKLVVMPVGRKDPSTLASILNRENITILWITSSLFNVMLEEHPASLRGVKQLLTGGEVLSVSHVEKALLLLPDTQLINGYGPTENTTFTCCYNITDQPYSNSIPIGRPIANTEVFVVDQDIQPVPVGVPGELITSGLGLARGYLNRPDLTREKFIQVELFGKIRRIYKTGDLVRLLPSGDIEFLGRMDNQVKLRGFRIELGEVEAALTNLSSVKEAVVVLNETDGDKLLVAYLTKFESNESDVPLHPSDLKEQLKSQLPNYMIPSHFMTLERFPLTPNGKTDLKALPLPYLESITGDKPTTSTEVLLADIWMTLFGHKTINRHDNFFDLGGHSLSATRLIARIRDNFQIELEVGTVFRYPQLNNLAKAIDTAGSRSSLPPIRKRDKDASDMLSFAQQRLWFLNQLEDVGDSVYNMPLALQLTGELNLQALQLSLQWLVNRHESLRTCFPTQTGQATVLVYPPDKNEILTIHDLTGLHSEKQDEEIQECIRYHASNIFDLNKGPLFRCDLLLCQEQKAILLLNMHHIISDGWSMGVFIRDWQHAYNAFSQGNEPNLAPLTIQYLDYAIWQYNWLKGSVLERQVDYWHKQLGGAPELLELPTDFPRPAVQSYKGAHYFHCLSPELTKDLTALSRELNVSLFMTLLSGFFVLLSRYSRMDDVCVGTPIANRTHSSTDDLIGFFVNTLVMRGRFHSEQSVAEMLLETRKTCLAAHSHQDIPFEMLVERLQPARSLSHSPLFQVMFGLQNNDPISSDLTGLDVTALLVDLPVAKFDLSLNTEERNGELQCWWEYATDLFHISTVKRMAEHFEVLLRAIVDDPSQLVSHLPMVTGKEINALQSWNDTAVDVPESKTIVELFEQQVENYPDSIAVEFGDRQLTYGELNEKANQVAHYLRALPEFSLGSGKGQNPLIGIFVERSLEMIVGLLAILKAGGGYVPVDPDYPRARICHILSDSGVSIILTQSALTPRLPLEDMEQDSVVVCLDEIDSKDRSQENQAMKISVNDLAYVIYTSGTTGNPKGVMIEHSAVSNFVGSVIDAYGLTRHDRVMQFASLSFDTAVEEVFATLLAGAVLVLRDEEMIGSTEEFLTTCETNELTVLDLPTAYWQSLLTDISISAVKKLWPKSIRLVVIGGEAVSVERVGQWLENFSDFPVLLNSYGPTEATVAATFVQILSSNIDGFSTIPIGCPMSNTRIYIMDEHLTPQPPGVPGELCIAGAGLARGYLNNPELTAEKFIEKEIYGKRERIYKTGDLARWLSSGHVEFLGRIDLQIKLRGFRIEPSEIETILCRHQEIKDAVVVLYEDNDYKKLVAYFTRDRKGSSDESSLVTQIRDYLKESVPDYMVPAHFIVIETIPLTLNGKLDRKKLPAPNISDWTDGYEAPSTPAEEIVANIWAQVLGVERVGRHDNFFTLGGHSLLVVQLVNRVQELFDIRIVVRELFEAPTVAGITRTLIDHEPQPGMVDTMARLQQELDQMSDEEIRAALNEN